MASSRLSHVAGILGPDGGFRVVVTARKGDFNRHHRQPGERVLIVPGLMVQEPVEWDEIPRLIRRVEHHVWKWMREQNEPLPAINNYLARMMNPS